MNVRRRCVSCPARAPARVYLKTTCSAAAGDRRARATAAASFQVAFPTPARPARDSTAQPPPVLLPLRPPPLPPRDGGDGDGVPARPAGCAGAGDGRVRPIQSGGPPVPARTSRASPGADVAAGPGPMCGAFGEAPTANEAVGGDADQRGGFAPCCVAKPGRVSLTEAGVLQGTSGGTAGYSGEVVKEKARTTSGCRSMRKRNRSPRSLFVCCA
jgi:hypothetical protein